LNAYWPELFRDIREGIRSQPGRTLLSFLAIGVGCLSLSALVAVLDGLGVRSREIVRQLGVNVIGILAPAQPNPGAAPPLTVGDAERLAVNFADCLVSVSRRTAAPVPGREQNLDVVGTDERLAAVRQWRLVQGRWLDGAAVRNREHHAVLTDAAAQELGLGVGDILPLKEARFRVIGIVAVEAGALTALAGSMKAVFIPLTVAPVWSARDPGTRGGVDGLFIRAPTSERFETVLRQARNLMGGPGPRAEADWLTPDSLREGVRQMQRSISWAAGGVTLLSLILGGTTLMSLMIANVKDRILEIGLRRALGATARDVALLFVVESCLITAAAALTGVLLAYLILPAAGGAEFPIRFGPRSVIVPLAAAILLGVVFSFWPAGLAARITPAEAMRAE